MLKKNTSRKQALELGSICQQRNHCCKFGSGSLVGDDLKNIAKFLEITEEEVKEKYLEEKELFNTKRFRPKLNKQGKPYGQCVFFGDIGCKIHKVKPLQCRIGNCGEHGEELSIWFMLNYLVNTKDPESIRQYNIYLQSGGKTIPGGNLEELIPDKEELKKILNFEQLK